MSDSISPGAAEKGLPPHEDWCCAKGCAGYGFCEGCAGGEGDCRCLVREIRHYAATAWDEALDHAWALNDPAYTILAAVDPARDESEAYLPLLTRGDIEHARRDNPYRPLPPADGGS